MRRPLHRSPLPRRRPTGRVAWLAACLAAAPAPLGAQVRPPAAGATPPLAALAERAMPHAEVIADRDGDGRPDRLGDTVVVAGRASVDGEVLYPDRLSIWIQDADAGIQLYKRAKPVHTLAGDSIVARGVVATYLGAAELIVEEYAVIPGPRRVPAAEPVALREAEMARHVQRLATVEGRVVDWGSDASGLYAVLESDDHAAHVALYVATPQLARIEMTRYGDRDRLRVTGILVPFASEYQQPGARRRVAYRIIPRGRGDIALVGMGHVGRHAVQLAVPLVLASALVLALAAVLLLRRAVARQTRRLLESEQRYRSLHDYNPDAVCSLDLEGRLRSANAAFEALTGWTAAALAGASLSSLAADEGADEMRAHFAAAKAGTPRHFELALRRRDGAVRALSVAFMPIVVDAGITGVFALAKDVTERVLAQRASEEGARLLSTIVETQRVIASSELDVGAVASRILEQVTRLTAADLAQIGFVEGDAVVVLPHMRSRPLPVGTLRLPLDGSLAGLAVRGGGVVRSDDIARDSRVHAVTREVLGSGSVIAVPLVYGGTTVGVLLVSADRVRAFDADDERTLRLLAGLLAAALSHARAFEAKEELVIERTAALEALRASEERFRTMIEHASDPMSILDADGTMRWTSPANERMLGYAPDEVIGRNMFELVHPDDVPRVLAAFGEVLAGPGGTAGAEYRFRHRDGSWRVMATVGRNLLGDPALRGIVINSRDITEQRRLEDQLRHAQKMEAVGQLAGGVAHDFNNILTVIRVHSTFLLEALAERDPRRVDAEEIQRAGDRAAALTRQLLAFSRRQLLQPRAIDLNVAVREMEPMLRRLIGEDIAVVTRLEQGLGCVAADGGQLEQVLMNLFVNARDAMPHGGTLTVTTRTVRVHESHRLAAELRPGDYAMLAVADTGHGMDATTRERVFEPFFTTKEQGKGTGLGLATVYGVVRQSGGTVLVESDPGVGSTFRLYLPCVQEAEATPAPPSPASPARGSETILIVEDEDAVRTLTRRILAARGYRIIEARHGRDAVAAARATSGEIHLVLTDVVMPEMGGRELAEALSIERPETRVLFMSGYTDDDILRKGLNTPGVAFLHKPFTLQELTEAVRSILDEEIAASVETL